MPIIEIDALPPAEPFDVRVALAQVTARVATFLQEEPRGTWAIFHPVAPGHFAEGDDAPDAQPAGTHPAIVRVFANREPGQIQPLLEVVAKSVVEAFGLEEGNVVVRGELADPRRMYWG
jgi:phenylpyruvate tautomerase PptA (4-oxalocrotonate tautomerase family)